MLNLNLWLLLELHFELLLLLLEKLEIVVNLRLCLLLIELLVSSGKRCLSIGSTSCYWLLLIHVLLLGHHASSWSLGHSVVLCHPLSHILLLHVDCLVGHVVLLIRISHLLLRSICLGVDSIVWSLDHRVIATASQEHLILKLESIWLCSSLRLRLLDCCLSHTTYTWYCGVPMCV